MPSIPLAATLARYVDIPSVTGEEQELAGTLAVDLEKLGLAVQKIPVSSSRFDVLAAVGQPRVVFCTHIDTVPPFFPFRKEKDRLLGRGACDAKGVLVAQIAAILKLVDEGARDLALLAVVGEEGPHDGARAAASFAPLQGAWIILGEPTGNRLAHTQKGLLKLRLRCHGRAAHSGYPERGSSALIPLLDGLQSLRSLDWPSGPDNVRTTMNIGVLQAGVAANVIPDRAEAELLFRLSGPSSEVERRARGALPEEVEVAVLSRFEPESLAVPAICDSVAVAFNTDAGSLRPLGGPISLLGPGCIEHAHGPGEHILEQDLVQGVAAYLDLVRRGLP